MPPQGVGRASLRAGGLRVAIDGAGGRLAPRQPGRKLLARGAEDLRVRGEGLPDEGPKLALAVILKNIRNTGLTQEILLDLVEVTRAEIRDIDDELVDFGIVGPGPRRILNWVNGRRWYDNDQDRSPAAERMYVDELRDFRGFLRERTAVDELRELNLLGSLSRSMLCEWKR